MARQKQVFTKRMDQDTEPRFLQQGKYRDAYNARVATSSQSNVDAAEAMLSTGAITYSFPTGTNKMVGGCQDIKNNAVILCYYNSNGNHRIVRVTAVGVATNILPTAWTVSVLGWTATTRLWNMRIVETGSNQLLFFHDLNGTPRRISLDIVNQPTANPRGSGAYTLTEDDISVIRKPPTSLPGWTYGINSASSSPEIAGKYFQFRYRYVYENGEISAWSPWSTITIPPNDGVDYNKITVEFNSGVKGVTKVQLARREGNGVSETGTTNPELYIFYTWEKGLNFDNFSFFYDFYNTEVLIPVPITSSSKLFDQVPFTVNSQEVVQSNQVIYGDCSEGYDNIQTSVALEKRTTSLYLLYEIINSTPDYIQLPADGGTLPATGDILVCEPTSNANAIAFTYTLEAADVASVDAFGTKIASLLNNYGLTYTASYNSTTNQVSATDLVTYIKYLIAVKGVVTKINDVAKFSNSTGTYASLGTFSVNWNTVDYAAGTVVSYFYTADNPQMYMCRISINLMVDCSNNSGGAFTSMDVGVWAAGPSAVLVKRNFGLPASGVYALSCTFDVPASLCQNKSIGIRFTLYGGAITTQSITISSGDVVFSLYEYSLIQPSFKSGQLHKFGLVYYDDYNRQSGVQKAGEILVPFISEQTQNYDTTAIRLTISNLPPSWAKKYQIVYAGCGLSAYSQFTVFPTDFSGSTVKLNVASILHYNYDFKGFEKGQKVRFIFSEVRGNFLATRWTAGNLKYYETTILSFDTSTFSIVVDNPDGILNTVTLKDTCFVEAFALSNSEFYYEFGQIYNITNGYHTGNTQNQTAILPAIIDLTSSDTYVRGRKNYVTTDPTVGGFSLTEVPDTIVFTETTTISDNSESDFWNKGRPQIETPDQKQQRLKWLYRWGGQMLQDTQVNNMSSFDSGNYGILSAKFGAITAMREVGYTLKMIQEFNYSTAFIGRKQIQNADGSTQLVVTDSLIGTVNPSEQLYGTKYPGSVVAIGRNTYWLDGVKGVVIRESGNGAFPISSYGMVKYWRDACVELDNSASAVDVFAGYDFQTEQYFITRKNAGLTIAKTLSFYDPERQNEEPGWISHHDFNNGSTHVDMYAWVGKFFLSSAGSGIWKHNVPGSYLTIYGSAKTFKIKSLFNPEFDATKIWLSHWLRSNQSPTKVYFSVPASSQNPNGMLSYLLPGNYVNKEASFYSDLKNDGYTKGLAAEGSAQFKEQLVVGRPLREQVVGVEIQYAGSTIFVVWAHDIGYLISDWSR